jgi:hypothetical protein
MPLDNMEQSREGDGVVLRRYFSKDGPQEAHGSRRGGAAVVEVEEAAGAVAGGVDPEHIASGVKHQNE